MGYSSANQYGRWKTSSKGLIPFYAKKCSPLSENRQSSQIAPTNHHFYFTDVCALMTLLGHICVSLQLFDSYLLWCQ